MAAAALMASRHEAHRVAGASEAVSLRPARIADCRRIAELFRISSEGVADYVWSQLQAEMPGLSLLEIGERRYRREDTAFCYQNCQLAERAGEVVGMIHAFVIEPTTPGQPQDDGPGDPVLRPYAELEALGSLYIAGIALLPEHRGRGIGTMMIAAARRKAHRTGAGELSLLCFESNPGARRLYEREGFRVVDHRPIVPHPMIHAAGDVLLMVAPARAIASESTQRCEALHSRRFGALVSFNGLGLS